jgi:hypothetical protein
VLLEYEQMDFQPMMIQELQRSAVVVDHQYFVEDHSKTCHEQYPEAKAKGQKMKMLEGYPTKIVPQLVEDQVVQSRQRQLYPPQFFV